MSAFEKAYRELNPQQREAVDTIFGPLLVIAGPGTGKTQLISTRIGYILKNTDTLPQNILCLTFTEAGVDAMRQRLSLFLGKEAYDIHISTYHAFGSDLLRQYPEFLGQGNLQPVDELGSYSILNEIIGNLAFGDPMKYADSYIGDLVSFISDCKRSALLPKDVQTIANSNLAFIDWANAQTRNVLLQLGVMSKKSVPLFEKILTILQKKSVSGLPSAAQPLGLYCSESLIQALQETADSGKTTPITLWKNTWLAKDASGAFIFDGKLANQKLSSAAIVYEKYQQVLTAKGLYDYDDMILRAIETLSEHADLKYTLAEKYQFILLDEFQDTNPAQLKLIELLCDHPVNEGRPNIMAVGDDDQAIYAFQGAEHANMAQFAHIYRDVKIISLKENYRSHHQVLDVAHNVAIQIQDRLHRHFKGVDKVLEAANTSLPARASIAKHEFISDAAQYDWIAHEIKHLVASKAATYSDIAVLAPKHKYLVQLLPYLADNKIPVHYEKRENILEAPLVLQLEQMARLTLALQTQNFEMADELWPEVLSYDFWGLSTGEIWQASWQASQDRLGWTNVLLKNPTTKDIASFFLRLKDVLPVTSLEQQFDALIGIKDTEKALNLPLRCPLFEQYFGVDAQKNPSGYVGLLSNLSVLRQRLRDWQKGHKEVLGLNDFVEFINQYRAAGLNILDTSPYKEAEDALNVMTAYGAKGREFKCVFVVACSDEVWGSSSRNQGSRISLPANLQYIRYRGASDDERLRLFFVAITRAKTHLYLTSYAQDLSGRATKPLKYLVGDNLAATKNSHSQSKVIDASVLESYWGSRHQPPFKPDLKSLLQPQIDRYMLSPTHLNQFIDVTSGGPQEFFLNTILKFPKAPGLGASYGSAIHETLHQSFLRAANGKLPPVSAILKIFSQQLLDKHLAKKDYKLLLARGETTLRAWAKQSRQINPNDKYEVNFANEGVLVGNAHLTGKIDRLIIDKKNKQIIVIDFKTGKGYERWESGVLKLHKYRQQLIMYKLLVEGSHSFAGYKVTKSILEFVEPDYNGQTMSLELVYEDGELEHLKKLVLTMWEHVQNLDFPATNGYAKSISGVRKFEKDIIN